MQQGILIEARLPGGHLQYRRAEKLADNAAQSGAVICEEPEDEDAQPARRQQAEQENGCQAFLHVRRLRLMHVRECMPYMRQAPVFGRSAVNYWKCRDRLWAACLLHLTIACGMWGVLMCLARFL